MFLIFSFKVDKSHSSERRLGKQGERWTQTTERTLRNTWSFSQTETCFFARYKRISMRSCYWSAWGPNNIKCCRPRWHATLGSIITVYFALKALNNDLLRRFADARLKKPRNIYFSVFSLPPSPPLWLEDSFSCSLVIMTQNKGKGAPLLRTISDVFFCGINDAN